MLNKIYIGMHYLPNYKTILGGIVFVFRLSDQSLTSKVIGLASTSTLIFDLVATEVG
jgi:hypothetical protein